MVELAGGNDGLNTIAPYGDDLYHRACTMLGLTRREVLRIDDYHGFHPRLTELKNFYDQKQLAVVQGVGYPNPDRSHFESMDIWQLADPGRVPNTGWFGRRIPAMRAREAGVPGMFVGQDRLPVALSGADGGVISLADRASFRLQLTGNAAPRRRLIEDLNGGNDGGDLTAFVRRRQLQTYTSIQKIEEALRDIQPNTNTQPRRFDQPTPNELTTLSGKLNLIARLIQKGLGTRIYYASIAGLDTHSSQADMHTELLQEVSGAVDQFFGLLGTEAGRVVLMTYSEFGRRVKQNGSRGTDHGSGPNLFVAGPKVAAGLVGRHPKLDDLVDGNVRFHTDFRRGVRHAVGPVAWRREPAGVGPSVRAAAANRQGEAGRPGWRGATPAAGHRGADPDGRGVRRAGGPRRTHRRPRQRSSAPPGPGGHRPRAIASPHLEPAPCPAWPPRSPYSCLPTLVRPAPRSLESSARRSRSCSSAGTASPPTRPLTTAPPSAPRSAARPATRPAPCSHTSP
ncbi:DUF1501 domain-containing protein [Urbifossiella limnaea]|uniref:DUF1501 domain-containing protein n=1 Tax=Urbifossiella limnaea TaxID=2528023 RepID=UPI00192E53FB|nr:DUF1501 domain-containing protein [Urbifossiella limnaea]